MSKTRAVIYVVGADDTAKELLEQVILLVGAARRAEAGNGVRSSGDSDLGQALGHIVERLVPLDLLPIPVAANEWLGEPVLVIDEIVTEPALDAELAMIDATVARGYADDLTVDRVQC